jgi:squalene-associated FAD-dependent desaturase
MRRVAIVGGGLAGLAAAAALGSGDCEVDLYESRAFLGGRAASYPVPGSRGEIIDNCQHILLRCCVNLLDLYRRLGVEHLIHFHREYYFLEPGGRTSILRAGNLPAPFHFTQSFLGIKCFDWADKMAIGRGLLALRRERLTRTDLDRITMLEWLREKEQTPRAISRFWNQVLVSAINESLDRMAAVHGFQTFWLGFLARADASDMGVPAVSLGDLYSSSAWRTMANVRIHTRVAVERICIENGRVVGLRTGEGNRAAETVILAVPFERVSALAPELGLDFSLWEHSPITGIHLWFDRPITELPHGTLLDRTIQWFFNKGEGYYLQLVVSASRSLVPMPRLEVIDLARRELADFFPAVRSAHLVNAHVVKEMRATYSARPGLQAQRPEPRTRIDGLYLAGDWTRTAWPATMEGAVRSGYRAAEAVTSAATTFLLPDIA